MCGIAGMISRQANCYRPQVEAMAAALVHRGPDDAGLWADGGAVLAHRRLSIIDPSDAGHQPMVSHCGRYVMVYNGEIYNYRELRRELESRDTTFRGHSDSEVLLAAFVAWGEDCLARLNGMWAFAIWDTTTQRLFLARDRFGIKPLYYAIHDGSLLFASEIKGLLATGLLAREANPRAVANFCAERVSDHSEETFFRGILQLPPGTCGWWHAPALRQRCYWTLPADDPSPPGVDLDEEIRALLEDAVRLRLRADTPIGTLLSGGLDSSAVTCLAQKLAGRPIQAFSTIDAKPPEEAAGIGQVMQRFPGITLHRDQPGADTLEAELEDCLWHQEEPFADGSMLAHFRLMRLAREHGTRVLLTGQAADEVFAGYPGHLAIHLGGLVRRGRWLQANAFRRLVAQTGQPPMLKNAAGHALPSRLGGALRRRRISSSTSWLADGWNQPDPSVAAGYVHGDGDPLNAALRMSVSTRTLPGFLHYEDRNSMAFGVETRIPFLDHRLVSRVLSLSGNVKLQGGQTKALLRRALATSVPASIGSRVAKQGYPAPLARWLRLAPPQIAARHLALAEACPLLSFPAWKTQYHHFTQGDDSATTIVWRGLILALWHARFVEQSA